jgi:hypothetical protein
MTITQCVTDLCLNEIERRGELTYMPYFDETTGCLAPIIPYACDYYVETVLTRKH